MSRRHDPRAGIPGILRQEGPGRYVLAGRNRGGAPAEFRLDEAGVPESLRARAADGRVEVRYDRRGGVPVNLRAVGPEQRARPGPAHAPQPPSERSFRHPYYFVPASPQRPVEGELRDRRPWSHSRHHPDGWSGRLRVRLVVRTPMLLPDTSRARGGDDHRTCPVRAFDEVPWLAATAVRGMLRTAFEMVTNSRFGRFEGHGERLAFRQSHREAAGRSDGAMRLRPVIIDGDDVREAEALRVKPEALAAAGLDHGARAYAVIERRTFTDKKGRQFTRPGPVTSIRATPVDGAEAGWVSRTGLSMETKRWERFFFYRGGTGPLKLGDRVREEWRRLLFDSRKANARAAAGPETARHLRLSDAEFKRLAALEERPTLAYARISGREVTALFPAQVSRELHPLAPDRFLAEDLRPPDELDRLSPADRVFGWVGGGKSHRSQLRVGPVRWLPPGEGAPAANGPDLPIRRLGRPLPLAILSAPKPQQARFYLGVRRERTVAAPAPGLSRREAGYRDPSVQHVRGRKVYPHQVGQPEDYWHEPWAAVARGERREYVRELDGEGEPARDDQNRSVEGWVEPGAEFEVDLWLVNLSDVELGALLWLMELPDDCCLKLGAGRPLGFGSVHLRVVDLSDLRRGAAVRDRYLALGEEPAAAEDPHGAIERFRDAALAAYRSGRQAFEELPFIAAFLAAARGVTWPVQYPRRRPSLLPKEESKGYEWFTANDDDDPELRGQRQRPLPDLAPGGELGLPYYEEQPPPPTRGGRAGRSILS